MRQEWSVARQFAALWSVLMICSPSAAQVSSTAGNGQSDTVVILDNSGSMDRHHRVGAKRVVNRFVYATEQLTKVLNQLTQSPKTRNVAVLTFQGDDFYVLRDLKPLPQDFKSDEFVRKIKLGGSTPLAKTIRYAADLLGNSKASYKSLVILTDGQDNDGVQNLYKAISYYNSRVAGPVHLHLFVDSVANASLWAEFKGLKDILIRGTLFLVVSGENASAYDEVVKLTYDSISGQWPMNRINETAGKISTKYRIHADHVHVIDNSTRVPGVRPSKSSSRPGHEIDWLTLKTQNPELYKILMEGLKALELRAMNIRSKIGLQYLLARGVESEMNGIPISNVYKEVISELFEPGGADLVANSLMPFGLSSALFFDGLAGSSALFSGEMDSKTWNTSMGYDSSEGNNDPGGMALIYIFAHLFSALALGEADMAISAGIVSSVVSANAYFSSAGPALDRADDAINAKHRAELVRFNRTVFNDQVNSWMGLMFPELTAVQIQEKVARITQPNLTFNQRTEILFGHDASYTPLLKSFEGLSSLNEGLEGRVKGRQASRTINRDEIRDLKAYLNGLLDGNLEAEIPALLAIPEKEFSPEVRRYLTASREAIIDELAAFEAAKKQYLKDVFGH